MKELIDLLLEGRPDPVIVVASQSANFHFLTQQIVKELDSVGIEWKIDRLNFIELKQGGSIRLMPFKSSVVGLKIDAIFHTNFGHLPTTEYYDVWRWIKEEVRIRLKNNSPNNIHLI